MLIYTEILTNKYKTYSTKDKHEILCYRAGANGDSKPSLSYRVLSFLSYMKPHRKVNLQEARLASIKASGVQGWDVFILLPLHHFHSPQESSV